LWHALVEHLRRHVILLSVAAEHLNVIEFPRAGSPMPFYTVRRTNPYLVTRTALRLPDGSASQLIFGGAGNTPFGLISNEHKYELGQTLRRALSLS
jgi:hypothetical protein